MRFTVGPVDTMWSVGFLNRNKAETTITSRTLCDQRRIPDVEGCVGSVDNGIFIHAIVPMHVETCCLLTKRRPDTYVHLTVDMEDYYRIKEEKR